MQRTLEITTGVNGGAVKLANDPKRPRNIHVTVMNLDTTTAHCAFFGRSRRELGQGATGLQMGFALPVPPAAAPAAGNGIQFAPGQGVFSETPTGGPAIVAVSSFVLQEWSGELWACADANNKIVVDVFDSSSIEK